MNAHMKVEDNKYILLFIFSILFYQYILGFKFRIIIFIFVFITPDFNVLIWESTFI